MRVELTHRSSYIYARPIRIGPQIVRLRPAPHNRTPVRNYSLRVQPREHSLHWQRDVHGNCLARIVVPEKSRLFEVQVDFVADLGEFNPFDFILEPYAERFPFRYPGSLSRDLAPYLVADPLTPALAECFEQLDRTPRGTVAFLVETNRGIRKRVEYIIRAEPGVQTPEETLTVGYGSCRDLAWLLVQLMRHAGIAARFVSGYLVQLTSASRPPDGPLGPNEDFTDLHAWCECYVPGAGWVGLDPTSGLLTAEGHIPLACSSIPESTAPIEGTLEKTETQFDFAMNIRRVVNAPGPSRGSLREGGSPSRDPSTAGRRGALT